MWIITVKNMLTGEIKSAECKYSSTVFTCAEALRQYSIAPYRCYIKYVAKQEAR